MVLIGLSGKKYSGKDEIARTIAEQIKPKTCYKVGFADALKAEVAKSLGITIPYLNEHKDNFRLILQGFGTDYKRKLVSDDYWIHKLLVTLNLIDDSTNPVVVVNDVRFLNEAKLIQSLGGFLIRVERPVLDKDSHVSETELDGEKFDFTITNNSSIEELEFSVRGMLNHFKITKQ